MADLSGEPSMEDILASIKRVIKEGEAPSVRRAPPPAPRDEETSSRDVLELNEPLSPPPPAFPPAPPSVAPRGMDTFEDQRPPSRGSEALDDEWAAPAPPVAGRGMDAFDDQRPVAPLPPPATPTPAPAPTAAPSSAPAPIASAADDDAPPVVSPATVEATRGALGALSRLVVKPEPDSDGTLEGLVRDMLRPMLSDWLDQNLPRLVEQMVAREIAKITQQK